MTLEKIRKLNMLSRQLTESLMSAALCANEISEIARIEIDDNAGGRAGPNGNGQGIRVFGTSETRLDMYRHTGLEFIFKLARS